MNWEAVGAISEVIASLAVVITLAYLAIQIRQNNVLSKEQAHNHVLLNQTSYFDRLAENPALVRTVYGHDLDESEVARIQTQSNATAVFLKWNWEYVQIVRDGRLTSAFPSLPLRSATIKRRSTLC